VCHVCSIRHVLYLEVRASFKFGEFSFVNTGSHNFSVTQPCAWTQQRTEQIICLRKIGPPQGEEHGVRGRRSTVEEIHARTEEETPKHCEEKKFEPYLALFGLV